MKNHRKRLWLSAVTLFVLYWTVEAIFCALITENSGVFSEFFHPCRAQAFRRIIVFCFFTIFYARVGDVIGKLENEIEEWADLVRSRYHRAENIQEEEKETVFPRLGN